MKTIFVEHLVFVENVLMQKIHIIKSTIDNYKPFFLQGVSKCFASTDFRIIIQTLLFFHILKSLLQAVSLPADNIFSNYLQHNDDS